MAKKAVGIGFMRKDGPAPGAAEFFTGPNSSKWPGRWAWPLLHPEAREKWVVPQISGYSPGTSSPTFVDTHEEGIALMRSRMRDGCHSVAGHPKTASKTCLVDTSEEAKAVYLGSVRQVGDIVEEGLASIAAWCFLYEEDLEPGLRGTGITLNREGYHKIKSLPLRNLVKAFLHKKEIGYKELRAAVK